MSRPRIYLAGPITGLSYGGATDWRREAKLELASWGIDGFSPLRAKQYLKGEEKIDGSPEAYQDFHPLSAPKGICTRDREDVRRADAVLMYLLGAERVSVGSMIEIGWADAFRVPLVVVMEGGVEYKALPVKDAGTDVVALGKKNPHHHAMVNELAGYVVGDLASAVLVAKALVLP